MCSLGIYIQIAFFFYPTQATICVCGIPIIYSVKSYSFLNLYNLTSWGPSWHCLSLYRSNNIFCVYKKQPFNWCCYYPSSAAQSHFLSQFLLDGGSVSVPQHLYSIHAQTCGDNRAAQLVPPPVVDSISQTSDTQQDRDRPFVDRSTATAEAVVRHVDSSSLSEDDVFYN